MGWGIGLFLGLERHFYHEKRSSKKKVNCKAAGNLLFLHCHFRPENGSLRLQKRRFAGDIP